MDIPIFGEHPRKRRREINLGGTSSATTHTAILQEARVRRTERQDLKRRQDSAARIQRWWRGISQIRQVKDQLRFMFQDDVTGITGLRCLVLVGRDERMLSQWSDAILAEGQERLLQIAADHSGFVLLRQISLLLLRSVSNDPQSPSASRHLQVLEVLLASEPIQDSHRQRRRLLVEHLVTHQYYRLLGLAVSNIPLAAKSTAPSLPHLAGLVTLPFSYIDGASHIYKQSLEDLLVHILTIPLLPNRLPIPSLTHLAPRLPLSSLNLVDPSSVIDRISDSISKVHLIANLSAFTPPRYAALSAQALDAYLQLTSTAMNELPPHALNPPERDTAYVHAAWGDESESDSESMPQVTVVTSFQPKVPLPDVDAKTRTRLNVLPSASHLNALIAAVHRYQQTRASLFQWCLALSTIWPAQRDKVLSALLAYSRGGFVRELYRTFVRGSPLGQDVSHATFTDPAYASHWPPLLLLVEMYTQALLTMGDDEFFSTGKSSSPRNPLTLDELTSFSRQLLNIAFALYMRDDQSAAFEDGRVPGSRAIGWASVREQVTKCLQAIHARDSRRPFTPPDHWLVTSQVDMSSFVDAAILEEQQLVQPEGARALSKRQVALMSPRLGILNNIPFAIPFDTRVSIFRHFITNDMVNRGFDRYGRRPITRVTVRRGSIAQDGFDRLQDADLKAPIAITFIDQFGQEEAGIDGGGVFKEFLTSLSKEVFDTDHGLWLATKQNELYPNPHSYATEAHSLNWYRFIGRILGKALYEGILVDVAFAGFFLAKWLGKQSFLDDLASLDPELYQGLIFLKHHEGNPEDLSLNFTVAEEEFGVAKSIPLIPNGSEVAVTAENRLQYIYLVSYYRLNKQIKRQSDAFFDGLSEMIDPKWLRMFNQQELQILLGGVNSPIDLKDLRENTQYGGLYSDDEPTIQTFWKVVNSFDHDQRRALLRFATSCSRPPLLGFKELVPKFAIRDSGSDEHRLPTASTCVNLLKLPRYKNEQVLREKLLQAIYSGAGFDLS